MQFYIKERKYKFTNGYLLEVCPTETENMSIATLYDPAGNVIVNTVSKPLTNRMGIVRHIESICKNKLTIHAENLVYSLSDVLIDEECMNLDAVVTPNNQSLAVIWVRLFKYSPQTDYNNCLHAYKTRASFTAYNEVKDAIEKAIAEYNYTIQRDKNIELEYGRITLDKRIIYFNNGKIRVEVSNRNNFNFTHIDENILGYDTTDNNKVIFKVKDYSINIYERNEILKKVAAICSSYGIDIQRMDGEESEYKHKGWGEFRVVPLKGGIKIYTPNVFNIQKNVNINYDDYERIIYCIKELVEKLNKNPMKYKIKETSAKKGLFDIFKK